MITFSPLLNDFGDNNSPPPNTLGGYMYIAWGEYTMPCVMCNARNYGAYIPHVLCTDHACTGISDLSIIIQYFMQLIDHPHLHPLSLKNCQYCINMERNHPGKCCGNWDEWLGKK